jgi:hypothetical protein
MPISPELMEILVCPQCRRPVREADDESGLICDQCRVLYPIEDGFPVMLIDEARPLD